MGAPKLIVLHVSPWSERARWALDHHGIAYRALQHAPFMGELRLRRIVGRRAGPATVPVLIDGDRVIAQSWDIALWADRQGDGALLIPAEHEPAVREWARVVDEASSHARALVVRDLLESPAALDESLPPEVPTWFRPLIRPITRYGTSWFARKYGLDLNAIADHERAVRTALEKLRSGLDGAPYLLGSFTFADIVAATLLQGIAPVGDEHIALGPATRTVWTRHAVATQFADLVEWRDELYRKHRKPAGELHFRRVR
jgi:glutathione S-transferase